MDCVIYEAAMEMEMRNWNRMKTRDYGYLIYRCNLKLAFNLILMHFSLNTLLVTSIARRWLAAEISHNFAHFLRPKRAISEIALTWLFYSSLFFCLPAPPPPCKWKSLKLLHALDFDLLSHKSLHVDMPIIDSLHRSWAYIENCERTEKISKVCTTMKFHFLIFFLSLSLSPLTPHSSHSLNTFQ